ncbi:hypothetical protein EI427_17415 [Flammeovirga pectinis]|uniref:Uncharacterized protein n=1 Tax=Flammeovirga pectinis TaxID=2494373 RepID=A0A3Q9FQZ0_9BACT|nr:hypothetical protein [Flammeovirga pectinis]AZQ63938.1 hypothetical protein EI427_17415 [Flammeovirga pectinis]
MKKIKQVPNFIIKVSFHLSVWLIEQFHDMKAYEKQIDNLRHLEEGTLGREIADCLDRHNLKLVPRFESHDLKHSLLGYEMTPVDEIRMQSFMIGNGNISLPSVVIFLFGFILLPHKWYQLLKDFQLGLNSKPIKDWTIEKYAGKDIHQLRKYVFMTERKKIKIQPILHVIAYIGSLVAMIFGGLGMLFCLPFLFSSVLEDLVGAGFPFVGGAILFIGGLISLSIVNKNYKTSYNA